MSTIKRTKEINKHISNIEDAKNFFADLLQERSENFDGKSEKWQEGEAGQDYVEKHSDLEDLNTDLEDALSRLEDIFEMD